MPAKQTPQSSSFSTSSSSLSQATRMIQLPPPPQSVVTGATLPAYEPSAHWNDADPYYTRLWIAGTTDAIEDRSKHLHPRDRWLQPPDPRNVATIRTRYDAAILLHLGRRLGVPGCQRVCCKPPVIQGEQTKGQ